MKYIFHCGEHESERNFKEQPDYYELDEVFTDWVYQTGVGCDEIEEMIDSGEAGCYEA